MFWRKKVEVSDFQTREFISDSINWVPGVRDGKTCQLPHWKRQRLAFDSDFRFLITVVADQKKEIDNLRKRVTTLELQAGPPEPSKKKPGRPKGSKNKPK